MNICGHCGKPKAEHSNVGAWCPLGSAKSRFITRAGSLVVLEGIDACGKATHAARLAQILGAKLFSFPDYGSSSGWAIQEILKRGWTIETELRGDDPEQARARILQALMAINRYEHAAEIQKTLASGQHVVCDRYYASGLVYGQADGLPTEWLWRIHESLPQPNCSLLIDIPPEESVRRRPERRDDYEKRAGFMEKVRAGYLTLFNERATAGPGRWYIVDGMGTEDEVASRILKFVERVCEVQSEKKLPVGFPVTTPPAPMPPKVKQEK